MKKQKENVLWVVGSEKRCQVKRWCSALRHKRFPAASTRPKLKGHERRWTGERHVFDEGGGQKAAVGAD